MKKTLLLLLCALLTMIGVQQVKAYTVSDLTSAGWTPVSDLDDITSNVYMFLDANSSTYAVEGRSTTGRATFKVLGNPFADLSEVWTVEKRSGGYAIRNAESQYYFNSGPNGWDSFNAATYESGTFTFTLNGTKYDIKSTTTNEYVGPWNSATEVTPANPGVAANKETSMGFYIYKMAKATYALKYLQQCPNVTFPVDMTYLIVNPTIYSATQATSSSRAVGSDVPIGQTGWTAWKSLRNNNNYTAGSGNTVLEAWSGGWKMNIDYYQKIASLPSGKYSVTAYAHFNKNSESGNAYVYVYGSGGGDKKRSDAMSPADADLSTQYVDVASGYINIGVETPEEITQVGSTALYLTADNFRLNADPYISTMATAFTNGDEMTAGLWYHFTVANTGKHILTATALDDIIYATGETTALSAAGSNKFSELQTLEANTEYYIRSSSNNTLTITPYISTVAEELPDNDEMAADKWYYFTTTTAGDYGFSSVDGVILTANGDQAVSDATGDPLSQVESLDASTTYYIKSETAQTVTKSGPYTYTIGTAASDKEYIQPGNTVTVSYASMATTNTYASEISTAITGVTLGGEPISVTRTTKGFTFTVPEVTAGSNYTLSIPADIIGYDAPGSGKNAAQEITLKVPVAFEGTYYLSTVVAGQRKWLNKDGDGYTYAYDQGLPFTLERKEGSGDTYKLKFSEGNYLNDVGSNWQTKIEGTNNDEWKLQAEEGGYKLLLGVNNDCQLFIANKSTGLIEITHSTNDGNIWEFVDPETALNYAIEKAEEHVLGFEAGEYAPYNNTAALAALATAEAATTTDARISAYAALTGATWTSNAEEVNAIYDGTFSNAPKADATAGVNGWSAAVGLRQLVESNVEGSLVNKGMYVWGSNVVTYGETSGYQMPLKSNTVYKLTYNRASWSGGTSSHTEVTITNPSGDALGIMSEDGYAGDWNATSGTLVSSTMYFVANEDGNYKISFSPWGNTVYTNLELKSTDETLTFADNSIPKYIPGTYPNVSYTRSGITLNKKRYATVFLPYSFSTTGLKVMEYSSREDEVLTFTPVDETVANTPYLVRVADGASDEDLTSLTLSGSGAVSAASGTSGDVFVGTYSPLTLYASADGYNYYGFSSKNGDFRRVSAGGNDCDAFRAYVKLPETNNSRVVVRFDDETTGIVTLDASGNINGAEVMQDGKYLIDGKIVIVKNGVKYDANGKKLN